MKPSTGMPLPTKLPGYTWFGLLILICAQIGVFFKVQWVATWLTPIMWSGYILLLDGILFRIQGRSWLTTRKLEFPLLVLLSIAIWILFEAYNFSLQNWLYRGVPENPWMRDFAYGWSFATILPGVFLTSEFVYCFLPENWTLLRSKALSRFPNWLWVLIGATLVLIPLTVPVRIARYLFGAVWLGFIFLLEPLNAKLGAPSLKGLYTQGKGTLIIALLLGGLFCGFLWEAWNYQAFKLLGGHWIYTVPEPLRIFNLHYGQMPILGMLGFPPFALELYVMYHFLRSSLEIDRLLGPLDW
jgi:hypothetical protein